MKRFRSIKLFTFLGFLLVVLFLVCMDFVQAQSKGKQAKDTWGIRIPAMSLNLMGMGEDYIYRDSDESISVIVADSKGRSACYHIRLFIHQNDNSVWASVPGVVLNDFVYGDGTSCGFPDPYTDEAPYCIEEFLAAQHPLADYDHIMFSLRILADIEDEILFPIGARIPWTCTENPVDVRFFVWNRSECYEGIDPYYHTISARVPALNLDPPAGFYITRLDANSWRFEVEMQDFAIDENYCVTGSREPVGKSGKWRTTKTYYHPVEGTANLSYVIDLIKNPN